MAQTPQTPQKAKITGEVELSLAGLTISPGSAAKKEKHYWLESQEEILETILNRYWRLEKGKWSYVIGGNWSAIVTEFNQKTSLALDQDQLQSKKEQFTTKRRQALGTATPTSSQDSASTSRAASSTPEQASSSSSTSEAVPTAAVSGDEGSSSASNQVPVATPSSGQTLSSSTHGDPSGQASPPETTANQTLKNAIEAWKHGNSDPVLAFLSDELFKRL